MQRKGIIFITTIIEWPVKRINHLTTEGLSGAVYTWFPDSTES